MAGGLYIEKSLSSALRKETEPTNLKFSPQETLVLRHLSKGLNAKRIGESMGLSVRIEDYKASMMKKAQAKSSAELVRFFFENGLN